MDWLKRIGTIDRRVIYVVIALSVILPKFMPLGLPISISPMTRQAYDTVEKLNPGDLMIQVIDFSVGYRADLWAATNVIIEHAASRKAAVALVAMQRDGPVMCDELVQLWTAKGLKYGETIVNLGYLPGLETGVAALARDFQKTLTKDSYGKAITEISMLAGVTDAKAFKLISVSVSNSGLEWVKQVQGPFGTPVIFLAGTMLVPQYTAYLQSGQLKGMLKGVSGAAEYETLTKKPAEATAAMEVQSLAHLVMIAFIVMGNLAYVAGRKGGATR